MWIEVKRERERKTNEEKVEAIRSAASVRVKQKTTNYSCFTRRKSTRNHDSIIIVDLGARRNFKWIFLLLRLLGVCSHESFFLKIKWRKKKSSCEQVGLDSSAQFVSPEWSNSLIDRNRRWFGTFGEDMTFSFISKLKLSHTKCMRSRIGRDVLTSCWHSMTYNDSIQKQPTNPSD